METTRESQFTLFTKKRFSPLFFTQFLGAFNDNVFKNVLVLMIAYQTTSLLSSDVLINVAAGLFILPFFLFSAVAGQLADKFEKSRLIRQIKLFEIVVMTGAALCLYFNSIYGLLLILFLMGAQSAFFGPVKYSILPQQLKPDELVGGNALVEMGTFVAILLGTITGGVLIHTADHRMIGMVVVFIAFAGWAASRFIPRARSASPELALSRNIISLTWQTVQSARKTRSVFLSIMAVSWFWFLGASYITQFPRFTQQVLNGSETVVTFLLACFSIGIGLGSLLCEKLSGRKVELGLVPLGALGLTLFGVDLCFAYPVSETSQTVSLAQFLTSSGGLHVVLDLIGIGIFGGFYTVPLYAYIQMKTPSSSRARVIAANNILNALLMVLAAVSGIVLLGVLGLTITQYFLVIAIVNLVVAAYIFSVVPEFFLRFIAWCLSRIMYRTSIDGITNIPENGPAVIASNHVSFVDWLLISCASRRPIRFVMYEPIWRKPVFNWIFRAAKAIPIQSGAVSPKSYARAFDKISNALANGEIICIFPEGKITGNGKIDEFKRGIEKIIATNPVPVVPIAISGMWGSFFSRKDKTAAVKLPRRFWAKVDLNIGRPILPESFNLEALRNQVISLKRPCECEA